jgi:glutamate-ammonia-ligase adenylyltransferase
MLDCDWSSDVCSSDLLLGILRPFVYRRYLDFNAIESLRELKRMISRELARKGMEHNIKLGPGGIREVEFIGQAFQIIRGGREPRLQIRPILKVLDLVAEFGLLGPQAVAELQEGYRFLRLVENRIQAWRDQQTHLLPGDPEGRLRLARAMGFSEWAAFELQLDRHRAQVQAQFDALFGTPKGEDERTEGELGALWQDQLDAQQVEELLSGLGFQDPAGAWSRLQQFRASGACRGLGHRGHEQLDRLMPLLLEALGSADAGHDGPAGGADVTLERLLKLLEAVARRSTYLALLAENGVARAHLVKLIGASPWIAAQLARQPLLLDELLDPQRLFAPQRRAELQGELTHLLAAVDPEDLEQQMERLRQFAQGNRLRVAAADLTGVIRLRVVSDYLTDIAEVTLEAVLGQCWDYLTSRHGRPQGIAGGGKGFTIVGYGKLGGIELGYSSDLDLVFLHGNNNPGNMTDGPRPIADDLLYARLGQRLIHMLSTRTPAGVLYEVDARLRPDGGAGLLVSSVEAFAKYQAESAWTWEHQALLRARPVAGDPQVAGRFHRIRREVLSRPRDPEQLRTEVREMRERMRRQLDRSDAGRFDLKQGPGGIADIEFMVQYAVLQWANRHPELLDWTANVRLLVALSRLKLLPGRTADELADAYLALRAAYHRNSLQNEPGLVADDRLVETRDRVRGLWQRLMEVG